MRRGLGGLVVGLVALIFVLMVRAATLSSTQIVVEPIAPVPVDDAGALARLRGGVAIQTISHEGGADRDEAAFAAFHEHLRVSYPLVHEKLHIERISDHSLLYRWVGSETDRGALVLLAHQDVVPIDPGTEEDWTHPPFEAVVEDGYLWGRGSLDDKGSLFAILEAIESLLADGFTPRGDVYVALGHDEELGGSDGAVGMAARLAEAGASIGLVVDEGGSVIGDLIPGVDGAIAAVGVAEKGYLSVALEVAGTGGHSSIPPATTKIGQLAAAVLKLEQNPFPSRLDGASRAFFERGIGPETPFVHRLLYANLWLFDPLLRAALDRVPGANALIRTTTAPTVFQAGMKDNVLPARARAVVNFRLLPGDSIDSVIERVRLVIDDPDITLEALPKRKEPVVGSSLDGEGWQVLSRSIREVFPDTVVAPYLMVAGTDSRHFRELCDCVYQFTPFRLRPEDMKRAHGTDERIEVAGLGDAVRFYRRLVANSSSAL
jgi:carboxypeptidase PM20D1